MAARRPRGPPTTEKQIFEDYERTIRFVPGGPRTQRKTIERLVSAQQRARTQGQRRTLATLCVAALDAEAEFQRRHTASAAADTEARNLIALVAGQQTIGDELSKPAPNWHSILSRAADLLGPTVTARFAAGAAWDALRAEHARQPPSDAPFSHDDAQAKRIVANGGIAAAMTSVNQYRQQMHQPPVPIHPITGDQKICPEWLQPERLQQWRRAAFTGQQGIGAAAFQPAAVAGPSTWALKKVVGIGGQGSAELWFQFDANNVLVNRLVRKTVDYRRYWYDVRSWAHDTTDVNNRLPWEIECNLQMLRAGFNNNNGGIDIPNEHVVGLRAAANQTMVDNVRQLYRIYTSWCPFGDLSSIIQHYRRTPGQPIVPEPFIWSVAGSLIYAGEATRTGTEDGTCLNGWLQIVHRDLKPGNILLGGPSRSGCWPRYPTALVADWGLAVKPTPTSNPKFYQGSGTLGCLAPEQIEYIDNNNLVDMNSWPLNEKTNVFGVGIVLYCLVTQQDPPPNQAWWLGDGAADRTFKLWLPAEGVLPARPNPAQPFANRYSRDLLQFIDACTIFDQGIRSDFRQLRTLFDQAITKNNGGEDPAITKGMRAKNEPIAQIVIAEEVDFPDDLYTLGLSRDEIP